MNFNILVNNIDNQSPSGSSHEIPLQLHKLPSKNLSTQINIFQ